MTGRAMAARSDETGTGSAEGNSAVANGDGPQITGDYSMNDISKSEPVPATNQAGEVECREALAALVTAAAEYQEAAQQHISDTRYDEDGNLAARDAELSVVALPRARAALATQPATSQEGGKSFASWSTDTLADQCRMQARDQLDPEFSSFLEEVADRLAATPTPPTLSEDLREVVERFVKLERRVLADMASAHSQRGPGASSEMRSDDRDDMAEANAAFEAARAALAQVKAS